MIYVFAVMMGVGWVTDMTSRRALVFDLVGASRIDSAMALESVSMAGGIALGTLVGGTVVDVIGVGAAFLTMAVLVVLAFVEQLPVEAMAQAGYDQLLLPVATRLAGNAGSLAVAAATLAAAALFQPLRRRVQDLVDRRFNRRRDDAARTVDAFAVRLRDQVDLDALHGELLAVVEETVAPIQASLWLRPSASSRLPT